MHEFFRKFSHRISDAVGSPWAFIIAAVVVVVWVGTGPVFGYSDTWQLVINTGTTIITFLMVFLIQNTQNRDSKILHLKLDELLRAMADARNDLIDLDDVADKDLASMHAEFQRLAAQHPRLIGDDLATVEAELHKRAADDA